MATVLEALTRNRPDTRYILRGDGMPGGTVTDSLGHALPTFEWLDDTESPTREQIQAWRNAYVYVPPEISRFQAKAALAAAGVLAMVEQWVAAQAPESVARLAWENAQTFRRDSPLLASVADGLRMSNADVDALFIAGAQIAP